MPDTFLYGPPPDPRQQQVDLAVVDHPELYLSCMALGLLISALSAWKRQPRVLRTWWFCLGQVIFLTAPLAFVLGDYVFGAWPTIDKTGSLLFYLDGVHQRVTFHPIDSISDPAARLIGVHVGHLWVTQLFDLFLPTIGAFNVQGIIYPALGWFCAALLLREVSESWRVAVLLGFPFGMGLHVFRDLNWYTIEKASVFALALFAWAMWRAWKEGGRWRWIAAAIYVGGAWLNWYWALVSAAGAGLALLFTRNRHVLAACIACAVAVSPLVALQFALLSGPDTLGDPDTYLHQRAMLDTFSLAPPRWNRLEAHRALNMMALGFALLALIRDRRDPAVQGMAGVAGGLFLLSLGPQILPGVWNPVYMGIREVVPGFWRVAKPEVFFEGTWLMLLMIAAYGFRGRRFAAMSLYPFFVAGWLIMVHSHPAYPDFTEYFEVELGEEWKRR